MAQHTQKLETLTVVKLTTEILITNTEISAYSETTFGGPTLGYVMTENWIYGCCGFQENVVDSHLGHSEIGHEKTVPRICFVNHIKTLLE